MIERSTTTMTQAFQLWLNRPLERLGWQFEENSIMTAFVEPLDTYANMTQLLAREAWPPAAHVENIAYFCGVLENRPGETQQDADKRVRQQAIAYLERHVHTIWPESTDRDGFDWHLLVDQHRGKGPKRFAAQFWRANFQPTERYVFTPPGSVEPRLRADESGYENLLLAGDWVRNGLDVGCVEAAVIAGMQAARAICGTPATIAGEHGTWLAGDGPPPLPSRARLPRYVEYGGLTTCPSPVDCTGSTLYSFFLEADVTRLRKLCRHVFHRPSGGQIDIRPLTRYVMLTFGEIDRAIPQLEPWSRMGWATERQVAFWIPVALVRCGVIVQIGQFVPYMWVNDPISLAGGREIYGYNKHWGWIGLPDDGEPEHFTLHAYGGNDDSGQPAGRCPLIKAKSGGAIATGEVCWEDLGGILADARLALAVPGVAAEPQLELSESAFEDILRWSGPPQFFLRQFRSITDGRRASGQQITDSRVTVQRIVGRPLLSQFEFALRHLDSHPIAAELGVRSQRPRFALKLEMDFVLEDGAVLWQA